LAVIKSLISAISMYSKLPMPNISYKEREDRFSIAFFPIVGLLILGLVYLLQNMTVYCKLPSSISTVVFLLIPVLVTGGIHIDGFMDCMDAIHSYGDHNVRLEILKDPHIGAFCVIKLLELIGIWYISAYYLSGNIFILAAVGFVVSRALSGFTLLIFPPAKNTGMLKFTRDHASKYSCLVILLIWIIASFVYCYILEGIKGIIPGCISIFCMFIYRYKSLKDFGGITGDTAGCFLTMTETAWLVSSVAVGLINI